MENKMNEEFDDLIEDENDSDTKSPEELVLEKEFEKAVEKAHKKIAAELKLAEEHLDKAVEIAEKYGVPFYANVSPLSNTYTPESFSEKFSEIDTQFVSDVTNTWDEESYQYGGWVHSAVC